ncbi:MAG: hypothetical protein MUC95_09370, partial [Spirochaetes bacterium]|nr:hypothetical protein [Spirochaetota bacterium]
LYSMGGGEGNYFNTIDNFYLLYSYNNGLLGLIVWFYLTIEIFRKTIKYFGKSIFKDKLVLLLLGAAVTFTVINGVVALFSYHSVFYIYLGILTRLIVNKAKEKGDMA